MSWHRAEQVSLIELPSLFPAFRRVSCACGCGCWFYASRRPGRPPAYCNSDHAYRARAKRRAAVEAAP
jgi:hypothetical protein